MPDISKEDYRSLELKLHTEIHTIFSQFFEDLENKPVEHTKSIAMQEPKKPDRRRKIVPVKTTPASAEPKRRRKSQEPFDTNEILSRTIHADKNHPTNILKSDISKIFGKKHRK